MQLYSTTVSTKTVGFRAWKVGVFRVNQGVFNYSISQYCREK